MIINNCGEMIIVEKIVEKFAEKIVKKCEKIAEKIRERNCAILWGKLQ